MMSEHRPTITAGEIGKIREAQKARWAQIKAENQGEQKDAKAAKEEAAAAVTTAMAVVPAVQVSPKNQERVAAWLRAESQKYADAESKNRTRGVRIGAGLLIMREALPHGQFMPWCEANIPNLGYAHCTRFMRLAENFIGEKKLSTAQVLTLADPRAAKKAKAKEIMQLAFDWFGKCETLSDLLDREGIKKNSKAAPAATGGNVVFLAWMKKHHSDGTATKPSQIRDSGLFSEWEKYLAELARKSKAGDKPRREADAEAAWNEILAGLHRELHTHKSHGDVDGFFLKKISAALKDAAKLVDAVIAAG